METQQMAMPAEMAAAGPNPDEMAIYDQMRQQLSPQEFSNEMLAGASQVDPQAVAEFTQEIQSAEISPEELEELNNVVDEILANPGQYDQIRQRYISQGLEEDLLPEQFDPNFFAALNMAVDQLIAAPAGVQAFAKGGIAELKPIAKAIASYGRNGDTMLAHITPAEARMLRRRGGAGTINPDTGLPEFFRRAFRKIKNAVKKFASSSVGRLVTTVALGFFLGPAAAGLVGATSVAGVAAVSGFVGSAGSTLLGGGNLRDALKAGAVGGLTAGAGAAIAGGAGAFQAGSYTGPTTVAGQVDKFKSAVGLGPATGAAPVDAAAGAARAPAAAPVPADAAAGALDATAAPGSLAKVPPPPPPSGSLLDTAKDFYTRNTPTAIRAQALPGAQEAGSDAVSALLKRVPSATPGMQEAAFQAAMKGAMPGTLATYGPTMAAGLGIIGAAGGFKTKEPELSGTAKELLNRDKDRVKIEDRPDLFYIQGLPGVKYDDKGKIIGSTPYTPTPTPMDDIRVPAPGMSTRPPMYTPETGSMGSGQGISQQYNTSSMYGNLMGGGFNAPPGGIGMPSMPGMGLGTSLGSAGGFNAPPGGIGMPSMPGMPPRYYASGGIAGLAQGGYPRRTGQISGPGTEKSDSIPAMLSDGEFVMTAKAVRGAGKGSRRAGAKKMYDLMHQLERNASRG